MMRKLAMAMVVSGALGSSFANALGLGEIKMNSGLNQPLDAEVKLLNVGDLSVNQILPNLASHKDFSRAGVERVFFLTGIKFEVKLDGQGGAILYLRTDRIVKEPFLNFLIELHWPSGRLLREYTALLDPPLFSEAAPVVVTQAVVTKPVQIKPVVKAAAAPVVSYAAPTYSAPVPSSSQIQSPAKMDGIVSVKKNDTLWGIAKENRPDRSVTVRQTMLAIQQHNPSAFIRNNINLLKSGQVLRIPDVEEIRRISSSQAYIETSRQNDEWASKKTIDATQNYSAALVDDAASSMEQGGLLKLVATDAESTDNELLASASGGAVDNNLGGSGGFSGGGSSDQGSGGSTIANVENLEKELQDLQRLMTLKQEQLALLQLTQVENEVKVAAAELQAEAELQTALDDAAVISDQSKLTGSDVDAGVSASQAKTDELVDLGVAETTGAAQNEAAQAESDAAKVAEIKAAAAEEARPEESVLDILTNNPLYIGVMIVVILGALILLGVISRRRNEEKEYPQELQKAIDASENDVDLSENDLIDVDAFNEEAPVASIADVEPLVETAAAENVPDDSRTLLEEADIYIAYGRYERAVEILQPAVNDAPENTELRLKLAEIFLASNELASFTQQDADLQAIGDADALEKLEELKVKYAEVLAVMPGQQDTVEVEQKPEQSDELAGLDFDLPDFETLEADIASAEEIDNITDSDDNLIEFTTDSVDDLFDIDLDEASDSESEASVDENILEFNLDEDLDLDEDEGGESQSSAGSASDNADDMDFLVDTDESATKLELAKAYIDMADTEAAQEILNEVVSDGSEEQQQEAKKLLENLA